MEAALALAGFRVGKCSVDVVPAPVFADEAADFVQPERSAGNLVARDKLDQGAVRTGRLMASYLKTQPVRRRVLMEIERRRPRTGVPGVQHVGFTLQCVGGVTRAHQSFGGRSSLSIMEGAAALSVWPLAAAGTSGRAGGRTGGRYLGFSG